MQDLIQKLPLIVWIAIVIFVLTAGGYAVWVVRRKVRQFLVNRTPELKVEINSICQPASATHFGAAKMVVSNNRGGLAIIDSLELQVVAHGAAQKFREQKPGKNPQGAVRFALRSDRQQYAFPSLKTPQLPPEKPFELVMLFASEEFHWYRMSVVVHWRDPKAAKPLNRVCSREFFMEFPLQ